jgi:glycosyltransferase involved in cell wall biosynthesis
LELASDLTNQFSILIVDDGSTDDTSAVVQQLSARYPQIALQRNRQRRGLGPIISMVQRHVSSDVVIVHDGVTPIDTVQVRRLWQQSAATDSATSGGKKNDIRDLALVRATHDAMARVHGRVLGFHLLHPQRDAESAPVSPLAATSKVRTPSKPRPTDRSGVGQIPPLPRPNFLSAMSEFALGE